MVLSWSLDCNRGASSGEGQVAEESGGLTQLPLHSCLPSLLPLVFPSLLTLYLS